MKIAICHDLHLNHASPPTRKQFYAELYEQEPDIILLGGDIGDSPTITENMLDELLYFHDSAKIYYVLGNHDCYYSSFHEEHTRATHITGESKRLFYLPAVAPVYLNVDTALVGHGLWYDGLIGKARTTNVQLTDFSLVKEMKLGQHIRDIRLEQMERLGKEGAESLKKQLNSVASTTPVVIVITHVSPFKETSVYDGKVSDNNWLPYFSCKQAGDVLLDFAEKNPQMKLKVYSGHSHGQTLFSPLKNLQVQAIPAEYGYPEVGEIIKI